MNIINCLKRNLSSRSVTCVWEKNVLTSKTLVTNHEKDAWTLKDPNKIMSSVSYSEHITKNKNLGYMFFIVFFCTPRGISFPLKIPIQFSSVVQSCPALCDTMDCSMPGFPVHHQLQSLLNLMSIELVMPSNHLILCCPLLLLPSIFPSNQGPFQWVSSSVLSFLYSLILISIHDYWKNHSFD